MAAEALARVPQGLHGGVGLLLVERAGHQALDHVLEENGGVIRASLARLDPVGDGLPHGLPDCLRLLLVDHAVLDELHQRAAPAVVRVPVERRGLVRLVLGCGHPAAGDRRGENGAPRHHRGGHERCEDLAHPVLLPIVHASHSGLPV